MTKWYFKTPFVVIAVGAVGPLALPLIWFHPRLTRKHKVLITIAVLILTYLTLLLLKDTLRLVNQLLETMKV